MFAYNYGTNGLIYSEVEILLRQKVLGCAGALTSEEAGFFFSFFVVDRWWDCGSGSLRALLGSAHRTCLLLCEVGGSLVQQSSCSLN